VILVEILSDRSGLRDVARKLSRSERLDRDDGIRLYTTPDLAGLGELADARCRERHGLRVFYNVNRHINYSNLCVRSCMFCAFAKRRGDEGGYEYTMDEVLARAAEAEAAGADEVHIVGGLHPDWEYEVYPRMLRLVREAHPGLHLKAFTAVEIDYLADLSGRSVARVLEELHEAGLGSLPGGGAEVLSDRVWRKLFHDKIPPARWLEIHEEAHRLGIRSNATLLHGHIETAEEKVDHALRLRELQDRTGGFLAFIPLRFHPDNTPLRKLPLVKGIHSLREVAVARLLLDGFDHVKAYWIMMGLETAQIALTFGANDLDGTVVEEKITHMAGARTPESMTEPELRALIREAGREPCRRDTLYREKEGARRSA
jgi:aminodeoxyfutalosine synthase